ncbi:hypothetical protein BH09ACT8_BH09ACT8_66150 [soil metagenome]
MKTKVAFVLMSLVRSSWPVPATERRSDEAFASPAMSVMLDPELTHVHGLHRSAAGTLLAGTHSGLFAIDPSRVRHLGWATPTMISWAWRGSRAPTS